MKTTEEIGGGIGEGVSGFGNGGRRDFEALAEEIIRCLRWVYDRLGVLQKRRESAANAA